jgi:FKBP-type peptidyl-prolyl cis-trans isomerase
MFTMNALVAALLFLAAAELSASGLVPAPADVADPPSSAVRTPSGLAMRVMTAGQGTRHPKDNDCVRLHFTAWARDGSFLSSSRQGGAAPQNQCLVNAFPGLAEALKKMVVGEQLRAWVPATLLHVADDDDRVPRVDATFDIELYEIIEAPPTPRSLKSAPVTARRMASGLAMEFLRKGKGTQQHPLETSQVKLNFSGWTTDGRLIESTVMAHHPAVFSMASVIRGWREALLQMAVGDGVRLWIPRDLAYGPKPLRGQPKGDVVYELDLLEIQ